MWNILSNKATLYNESSKDFLKVGLFK
ncbi:MAG: hypothetical protein QG567_2225, partial [Campylobacterota bacterium]|nr:hypothetical protein [Campylobacterota bacterium]